MAHAEFPSPSTDEYRIVDHKFYADFAPELAAGVFTPEQLTIALDPEAGEVVRAEALGKALLNENPDFWLYVQKSEYRVDPNDPLSKKSMWFLAGMDYAVRQVTVSNYLNNPDLMRSMSPHDRELLTVARIEEKQALIALIQEEQQQAQPNSSQLPKAYEIDKDTLEQERIAANELLGLLDDNNAFNGYLLRLSEPVDVKKLIQDDIPSADILALVKTHHEDFKQLVEHPTQALTPPDIPLPYETDRSTSIREQAQEVKAAVVLRLQQATHELEQLPIRQKLAAAAITGVVAAVSLTGVSKNGHEALLGPSGKAEVTMVNPASIKDELPSELARHRLKLSPNKRIPADERKSIIVNGSIDYAKAIVDKFNDQNGISGSDYDQETQASINKMDAIVTASLGLASHRQVTTPKHADELSKIASNIMLAARNEQIARNILKHPKSQNLFQEEIIRILEDTFAHDKVMQQRSEQYRNRIFSLQARLLDEIAPEDARTEVIEAFIAHLAEIDGILQKASPDHNNSVDQTINHELNELNPRFTLAQLLAATSIIESGSPANPKASNWAGCYGYLQYCYWSERARKYLGDANAPKTTSNQTIMAIKEWTEVLHQLGSGDAAAATWLKGPLTGRKIAGLNKGNYLSALQAADGNGTSVLKYLSLVEHHAKTVNVDKQLPFLKEVKRLHPNAVDWSLLDKEWPLYSYHRLRQVKPHANQVLKNRAERVQQARHKAAIRHNQKYNSPAARAERAKHVHIDGAVNLGMRGVHVKGRRVPTRLYAIEGFYSSGEESKPGNRYYIPGARHRVIVGARHAKQVASMFKSAKEDDIVLSANSSLRINPHQHDLWDQFGRDRNRVALPGFSGHEDAINQSAIDINLGKHFSFNPADYPPRDPSHPAGPNNPRVAPNSKNWRWLHENAHKYGYKQFWNEPWHWSVSGR
jgi:hypothetical protein